MKKFEEGVFSDLRNLKPGVDACLEEPKSPFLDLLFKYQCIRTQKKQKVFYWCVFFLVLLSHMGHCLTDVCNRFSVPHDRLFLDALERDLKREKMGSDSTTQITGTHQLSISMLNTFSRKPIIAGEPAASFTYDPKRSLYEQFVVHVGKNGADDEDSEAEGAGEGSSKEPGSTEASRFFSMVSLFGAPSYKTRRKRAGGKASSLSASVMAAGEPEGI